MAITRANAEAVLIKRCGKKMVAIGMDGTTVSGANADLNDPIATALITMGLPPASFTLVVDNDLSGVSNDHLAEFLDRAEFRLLESILNNIDLVDVSIGPRRESLSQMAGQVKDALDRKTVQLAKLYGAGVGSLDAGAVSMDFQAKFDDRVD